MDDTIRLVIDEPGHKWHGCFVEAGIRRPKWGTMKRFLRGEDNTEAVYALVEHFARELVDWDITEDGQVPESVDDLDPADAVELATRWLQAVMQPPLASASPSPVSPPPVSLQVEPSPGSAPVTQNGVSMPSFAGVGDSPAKS